MSRGRDTQIRSAIDFMQMPGEMKIKSIAFWMVGLSLIVFNAVWGPQSLATFAAGLTLCGIPSVVKLDNLIKVLPNKIETEEKE